MMRRKKMEHLEATGMVNGTRSTDRPREKIMKWKYGRTVESN